MSFDTLTSRLTSTLSLSLSPLPWASAEEKRKRNEEEEKERGERDIEELFVRCRDEMPERWRGSWYIVVATALLATNQPHHLRSLYIHLTRPLTPPPPPRPSSPNEDPLATPPPPPSPTDIAERNRLTLRLRDTCQKAWILTGIAPVLVGVGALAQGEAEMGHHYDENGVGGLSERWKNAQINASTLARGQRFVESLYAHNLAPTFANAWGSHLPDLRFQQEHIIYGLFLSEHSILSGVETEFVTLSALLCGRVDAPKRWHLRGLRRLGVQREDVGAVVGVVGRVALFGGRGGDGEGGWSERGVKGWPGVGDVEAEV